MIQAYNNVPNEITNKKNKPQDIIIETVSYEEYENEKGEMIKKRIINKTNITKKANETARILKEENAIERIEKILNNESKEI